MKGNVIVGQSGGHLTSRIDILEAFQVGGAAVKAADVSPSWWMVFQDIFTIAKMVEQEEDK